MISRSTSRSSRRQTSSSSRSPSSGASWTQGRVVEHLLAPDAHAGGERGARVLGLVWVVVTPSEVGPRGIDAHRPRTPSPRCSSSFRSASPPAQRLERRHKRHGEQLPQ
jgi:hypothetical protein